VYRGDKEKGEKDSELGEGKGKGSVEVTGRRKGASASVQLLKRMGEARKKSLASREG